MEPRIDLFTNEIGAKFAKRFANAGLVIAAVDAAEGHAGAGEPARQPDQRLRLVRRHAHQGGRGRR